MPKASTPSLYDLLEACKMAGCPVCRIVDRSVRRWLDFFFYESVNDIPMRAILRASRGFCNLHAAVMLEIGVGNPLGISIIYHDVLSNVLRDLPPTATGAGPTSGGRPLAKLFGGGLGEQARRVLAAFTPRERCLACRQQHETTQVVISLLVKALNEGKLVQELEDSAGLCLPHFSAILQHKDGGSLAGLLLELHRPRWQKLDEELAEFIRKNDHRYQDEPIGSERDAWRRALGLAAGESPLRRVDD